MIIFSAISTVFLVVWVIGALLIAIFPFKSWELLQGWKTRREPSSSYFIMVRVLAIIMFIIGIALLSLNLFHN
ncbi:hypothetical protein C162_04629 [Paenibacillus sp. FSL R7-269]|nr:hypothetical protein C162_04629 [Paenibacillus sp. FSL R7-269]